MPNGNRTGPDGNGPMTGRGLGKCGSVLNSGFRAIRRGFGFGRGMSGRGMGYGRGMSGRGMGYGRRFVNDYVEPSSKDMTKDEEKQLLEEEKRYIVEEMKNIESEKQEIEKRLKELE